MFSRAEIFSSDLSLWNGECLRSITLRSARMTSELTNPEFAMYQSIFSWERD